MSNIPLIAKPQLGREEMEVIAMLARGTRLVTGLRAMMSSEITASELVQWRLTLLRDTPRPPKISAIAWDSIRKALLGRMSTDIMATTCRKLAELHGSGVEYDTSRGVVLRPDNTLEIADWAHAGWCELAKVWPNPVFCNKIYVDICKAHCPTECIAYNGTCIVRTTPNGAPENPFRR